MGQIIPFRLRAKISQQAAAAATSGGAQILFFLGVRYSRMDEEQDLPATREPDRDSSHGSGRKRRKRARG